MLVNYKQRANLVIYDVIGHLRIWMCSVFLLTVDLVQGCYYIIAGILDVIRCRVLLLVDFESLFKN